MEMSLTPLVRIDSSQDVEVQKRRLRENCREFESVMVSYMMKTMRDSVMRAEEPENAREIYEDMLAGQISREMGKNGALGVGDLLYSKLEHLLETQAARAEQSEPAKPDKTPPGDRAAEEGKDK